MTAANETPADAARAASIHRELLQLAILILVAVAAFFLTRAVAASNREMNLRDAAQWYRRGQQALDRGRVDEAVDAFRRATTRNHTDKGYRLGLARALALHHDTDAARRVFGCVRISSFSSSLS